MTDSKFYITFPGGDRKEVTAPAFGEIENKSLFANGENTTPTPSEWNIKMSLRNPNQARELRRVLLGDIEKAERYLLQGLRLLRMWQDEKEPHRKKYYWQIHELKLLRALGKRDELQFTINGGERITLKKDERGKARLYRMDKANQ